MKFVARTSMFLAVVVIAFAVGECNARDANAPGVDANQASPSSTVNVSLTEFAITPSRIDAPAGRPFTIHVSNNGTAVHTFTFAGGGRTFDTGNVQPGATADLPVPALPSGNYQAFCSIPGHRDLGMVASITAGAGASAGTGSQMGMSQQTMASMSPQQMADMHKQGVEAFLAGNQTKVQGGRLLRPSVEHGVKVFTLTAEAVKWETSKGVFKDAFAYNGQVPGPQLDVRYGDHVRIVLQNQLPQPTVLHFHGMTVPNAMDGVPYVTQDPVMPGDSFVYDFTVKDPPGMYVYHSHFNSTEQVGRGLFGAIMVEPRADRWPYHGLSVNPRSGAVRAGGIVHVDDEYTMFLADGPLGYTLQGKSFPATAPLSASKGDWVLIHLANDGSLLHPMHLHGYHFEVVAQDGFPLADPYMADTLVIAPGQRFDVLVHAIYPGAWAFHCHILPHVEGPQGMYGMVTALVVS